MTSIRNLLLEELRHRQSKNPAYSLRAYARYLDLPAGRVSQYLTGKRKITESVAKKIADRLGLSPEQEGRLQNDENADSDFMAVSEEMFRTIADWEHFAILNLIRIKNQKHTHDELAQRLGVATKVVDSAIERLLYLRLISVRRGRYYRTEQQIKTSSDVSSRALRVSHRQSLQQAIASLEETSIEYRDITSITMPISTIKLPLAKEMIKAFRRKLSTLLEGEDANEVYNLNIQLVPVTKLKGLGERHDG